MTPRIRSLVSSEPLIALPFQARKAPQVFREFIETLQRLNDRTAKVRNGNDRARPKQCKSRNTAR